MAQKQQLKQGFGLKNGLNESGGSVREKGQKPKTAIALSYEPGEQAPKILATGKGALAERIIDAAKEAVTASYKNEKEKRRLQKVIAYREIILAAHYSSCLLYTSPSPRDS